jgi:phosphatidylserine/phosphatidylglycerophosphate/cardiolipin synthase-like enzyme
VFKNKSIAAIVLFTCMTGVSFQASAYGYHKIVKDIEKYESNTDSTNSFNIPARGKLEVAFAPNEGSEHLVIKVIDSATKELLILSYGFSSKTVTEAMIRAVHRGVTVRLVADYRINIEEDKYGKARAALSAVKNAGIDVRIIRKYPVHHDKVVIVDRQSIELGSFNYTTAAAHQNSENALVNWDNPELAAVYLKHFERNYNHSEPYEAQY